MRQPVKTSLLTAFIFLAMLGATLAETVVPVVASELNGEWKVLLENANSRKYIRLRVEEKEGRLRGKMASRETGTQDLDGRCEEDGKILFWSTFYTREGISIETSFKGKMEGEAIVGNARYFDKAYKFRAERVAGKDKPKATP